MLSLARPGALRQCDQALSMLSTRVFVGLALLPCFETHDDIHILKKDIHILYLLFSFAFLDRVGGRAFTDQTTFSKPTDMGAMWIHGIKNNPVYELAQKYSIKTTPTDYLNVEYVSAQSPCPHPRFLLT